MRNRDGSTGFALIEFLAGRHKGMHPRGKAIRDERGLSVRQRAFAYFDHGLRPSQLPPMGVPDLTLYRYHQAWKHQADECQFRVVRELLKTEPEAREFVARHLNVTTDDVLAAVKGCRSAGQLRRRLRARAADPESSK